MIETSALTVICTAIPATMLALGTLITSVRNSAKADTAISKTDAVIRKADEIHTLTNSTMTQVRSDLQNALTKITEMERLIAALTAANMPREIAGPAGPVGPPGPAGPVGSLWGNK